MFLTSFFSIKSSSSSYVSNTRFRTLNSFILALRKALVAKLVISGALSSIFLILALYTSFLITPFFTISLSLLKSTGAGTNLSTSNLSSLLLKWLKLVSTFFNLSFLD